MPLSVTGAAIDVHTHLMSTVLSAGVFGKSIPASTADELIARMDEANVDKAVVLSLGFLTEFPDERLITRENEIIAEEVAKYPNRLIGFCGVSPLINPASEIDRCLHKPGMVGIKLHLPGARVDMTEVGHVAALSATFDKAGEVNAPVLMHVGTLPGLPLEGEALKNLVGVVSAHPKVRLLLAHCAGPTDDENMEIWLQAFAARPSAFNPENIFLDLSGCLKFFEDAPLSKRELIVWRLRKWGLERAFFGSDYLRVAPAQTPKEALRTLTRYPFTQKEIDFITSNDASLWLEGR